MKVLLVFCLIFGLTLATPPFTDGLAGVTSVVGDLAGTALSIVRFFRDSTERFNGGGDSDLSTNGQVVDGQGGGINGFESSQSSGVQSFGGGSSSGGGGFSQSGGGFSQPQHAAHQQAPPQHSQGQGFAGDAGYAYNAPPQQSFSAVAPQQNYGPPQQNYGPPATIQQAVSADGGYDYSPRQAFSAVAPQQNYGPPQQNYGPPQQSFSAVAPQNNYAPPPQPDNSYLPAQGHSSGGHTNGGAGGGSSFGESEGHESEGEGESEGGSSFDIGSVLKFKTGLLEQGRAASNRHWDRKSSGLTSLFGILSGISGGGGSDSNGDSESSSHGESSNSGGGPYP